MFLHLCDKVAYGLEGGISLHRAFINACIVGGICSGQSGVGYFGLILG